MSDKITEKDKKLLKGEQFPCYCCEGILLTVETVEEHNNTKEHLKIQRKYRRKMKQKEKDKLKVPTPRNSKKGEEDEEETTTDLKKDENEKIINCRLCGQTFKRKDLKKHKKDDKHLEAQKTNCDTEFECEICNAIITLRTLNTHKKSKEHKQALKNLKPAKTQKFSLLVVDEVKKIVKQRYYIRSGKEVAEQHQLYINTLAAFLILRYSFHSEFKDLKMSINENSWGEFGDIVIEITNQDLTEIEAIQVKQVQNRSRISVTALKDEKGKFSIKKQCDILKQLRRKKNYDKTSFKLFTVSTLMEEVSKIVYQSEDVDKWRNKSDQKSWKDKEMIISQYKKKNLLNSTDEPDDICIFKILGSEDRELDEDLGKFMMFTNQKKIEGLNHAIGRMVEDKFDSINKNISSKIVKFIGDFFKTGLTTDEKVKYFKMTKLDILLKTTQFLLEPNLVFPESIAAEKKIELWNDIIKSFDVIFVKNSQNIVGKIFSTLNWIMKSETDYSLIISNMLKIDKNSVTDESLKSELFDDEVSKNVPLPCVYLTLWKVGLIPLVLTAESEKDLSLIVRLVSFLKSEKIAVKFIIASNLVVDHGCFPENLKVFLNVGDLQWEDEHLLNSVLGLNINILHFLVRLGEINEYNGDFLEKLTPDALLNILLNDYSFKDVRVPISGSIVDNTLVLSDDTMKKIFDYFENRSDNTGIKSLSYLVNVKGRISCIEVPPDI